MNIKLVGILFAVGSLLACGDSGSDSGGGPAGGSNPGGSNPGGSDPGGAPATGGGGGGTPALTCQTGCEALFNCGLEGTPPYCVYTAADEGTFVPGCVDSCADNMALLNLIDTEDCEGTINTIKALNPQFKTTCEDGLPVGGGGTGGAGGAQ